MAVVGGGYALCRLPRSKYLPPNFLSFCSISEHSQMGTGIAIVGSVKAKKQVLLLDVAKTALANSLKVPLSIIFRPPSIFVTSLLPLHLKF